MSGGSFVVSDKGDYTFTVYWSSSGYTVSASLLCKKKASNSQTYNNGSNSSYLRIDGSGWSGAIRWDQRSAPVGDEVNLANTTVTVGRNTFPISVYFPTGTSNVGDVSESQTVTIVTNYPSPLNNIANFNLEDSVAPTYGGSNPAGAQKNLTISVGSTTIRSIDNFASDTVIKFTSSEIAKIYKLLGSAKTGSMKFELTTVGYGTSERTPTITCAGTSRMNISDTWKKCIVWMKINGTWLRCVMNEKISSIWKRGK